MHRNWTFANTEAYRDCLVSLDPDKSPSEMTRITCENVLYLEMPTKE